jgi:hypothetical protein
MFQDFLKAEIIEDDDVSSLIFSTNNFTFSPEDVMEEGKTKCEISDRYDALLDACMDSVWKYTTMDSGNVDTPIMSKIVFTSTNGPVAIEVIENKVIFTVDKAGNGFGGRITFTMPTYLCIEGFREAIRLVKTIEQKKKT